MALTVEDGTGLELADSYTSLVDARTAVLLYGWVLPTDDDEAEVALRNGAQYVDLRESSLAGSRLVDSQGLAYPRVDGFKCQGANQVDIASDEVPKEMIKAQIAAAVDYGAGNEPRPNDDNLSVQEETVDVITTKYFEGAQTGGGHTITAAIDAMRPLLCLNTNPLHARTLRA